MSPHRENQSNATILKHDGIYITEGNLKCLDESEHLDENIINFWLGYMYDMLLDENEQERMHICDTNFVQGFEQLDELDAHHLQHRIKPFEKDFVIIPVNVNDQWLLVTWEYPRHAYNEQIYNDLIFRSRMRFYDSMGSDFLVDEKNKIRAKLTNFIRKAIVLAKNEEPTADNPRIAVRDERVRVQINACDSGLHLLENAERFMVNAFDKHFEDIETNDKVVLLNSSKTKRTNIKKLIMKMGEIQVATGIQEDIKPAIIFN